MWEYCSLSKLDMEEAKEEMDEVDKMRMEGFSHGGENTPTKNTKTYFSIKIQIRLYFSVYCVVFFLPVPIRVCRSIAPQQPMKILEGMEWKSRDHVSPQECSADKAGLPPNYTNLEKQIGAKLVSVHIPNYVLLYNLSAVIVWRKSRVTWLCFWGEK